MLERLLTVEADVAVMAKGDWSTALHVAAGAGHVEVVRKLMEAKGSMETGDIARGTQKC